MKVPPHDNFQVMTGHDPLELLYDAEYIGIACTQEVTVLQIIAEAGRTLDVKNR